LIAHFRCKVKQLEKMVNIQLSLQDKNYNGFDHQMQGLPPDNDRIFMIARITGVYWTAKGTMLLPEPASSQPRRNLHIHWYKPAIPGVRPL
jgi:hypothetical protein